MNTNEPAENGTDLTRVVAALWRHAWAAAGVFVAVLALAVLSLGRGTTTYEGTAAVQRVAIPAVEYSVRHQHGEALATRYRDRKGSARLVRARVAGNDPRRLELKATGPYPDDVRALLEQVVQEIMQEEVHHRMRYFLLRESLAAEAGRLRDRARLLDERLDAEPKGDRFAHLSRAEADALERLAGVRERLFALASLSGPMLVEKPSVGPQASSPRGSTVVLFALLVAGALAVVVALALEFLGGVRRAVDRS